jgi:hypothetical protein
MSADQRFRLEVSGDEIIVTAPGTSHCVVYQCPPGENGLMAKTSSGEASDPIPSDEAPITHTDFRARAWVLAHDKARELGWIA